MITPIAIFIYNRPNLTKRVFERVKQARPRKLLIVADGPRSHVDTENCEKARAIVEQVDWDCDVLKNYSEHNIGCKLRVSSGLDWVFNLCEEAIILEDDCLPNSTFFRFCQELLIRYRNIDQIMMISGDNFQHEEKRGSASYYFSRYFNVWGWASWKRAWKYYDVSMKLWPEIRKTSWLYDIFREKRTASYWRSIFDDVHSGKIDTWDYQWLFAGLIQNGLSILPSQNLISNIGFGNHATHTIDLNEDTANLKTVEMDFPLNHPTKIISNDEADLYNFNKLKPNSKLDLFANRFNKISRMINIRR